MDTYYQGTSYRRLNRNSLVSRNGIKGNVERAYTHVLIDLKLGVITHQDVGQMDMYVRMYDELKRTEGDNPTIGIVLCSETSKDIARYSILKDNDHATKYKTFLPTEEQLRTEIDGQVGEVARLPLPSCR